MRRNSRRASSGQVALIERVEPRRLLSVSLSGNGVLRVSGTEAADEIAFALQRGDASRLRVVVNGTLSRFNVAQVKRIHITSGDDGDFVHLGGLKFRTNIDTAAGNDTVFGGSHADFITTGGGNDSVKAGHGGDYVASGDGDDIIFGERGVDEIFSGSGNDAIFGGDGNDFLQGSSDRDTMSGDLGDDHIEGGLGDDSIMGGDGNDYCSGYDGDDRVFGDRGDDRVYGGNGNDLIWGGRGSDEFGAADTDGERRDYLRRTDRIAPSFISGGSWTGNGIVSGGGSLSVTGGGSSGSISLAPGSVMDISNNAIVVDYADGIITNLGSLIATGDMKVP